MTASTAMQARPQPARLPAAVIFDMDGLMLDTEPLAARAWTDAARALGVGFDDAIAPRLVGRNFTDCRRLISEHHGEAYPIDALMSGWHSAYDAIVAREGVVIKPGLIELIDWIEARALRKAVATSTRRSRALTKLRDTGLLHRFSVIVGGDEVVQGKPAPDIFIQAAARIGTDPAQCMALEDSAPGVRAASAAGMQTIMIPELELCVGADLPQHVTVMRSLHDVRLYLETLAA
ncbi:MAG: HAD family phosphatase [Pseudomonadota bacterium]|nr:HAD family phosphatase [Pseudomonadota bacterium]